MSRFHELIAHRGIKSLGTANHRGCANMCMVIRLHSVHGNDWKRISTIIGRDANNVKDKWRIIKSGNQKTGKLSFIRFLGALTRFPMTLLYLFAPTLIRCSAVHYSC